MLGPCVVLHIQLFNMGERMLGILILVSFYMPKGDSDWVAELNGVTDGLIHIVVVIGGIIRPCCSCIKQSVYVRDDALVIAEALDLGTIMVGFAVVR